MSHNTLIFGAGWLGLPLALALIEQGHHVLATTSSKASKDALHSLEIEGLSVINWPAETLNSEQLSHIERVIITLPARRNAAAGEYLDLIQQALTQLAPIKHQVDLLFTSSTGVYQSGDFAVNLATPLKEDMELVKVEQLLRAFTPKLAILRLAGLIGPAHQNPSKAKPFADRHPAWHLSGKNKSDGATPVNLIHQADVIRVINHWQQTPFTGTYNLVYPQHPTKQDYYTQQCQQRGIAPPNYSEGASSENTPKRIVEDSFAELLQEGI